MHTGERVGEHTHTHTHRHTLAPCAGPSPTVRKQIGVSVRGERFSGCPWWRWHHRAAAAMNNVFVIRLWQKRATVSGSGSSSGRIRRGNCYCCSVWPKKKKKTAHTHWRLAFVIFFYPISDFYFGSQPKNNSMLTVYFFIKPQTLIKVWTKYIITAVRPITCH